MNGDVDMVCNFIGDARFIKQIADQQKMKVCEEIHFFFDQISRHVLMNIL
jgi:hypothetical protein